MILQTASRVPFRNPCLAYACLAYSEQLGWYLQQFVQEYRGEINSLQRSMKPMANLFMIYPHLKYTIKPMMIGTRRKNKQQHPHSTVPSLSGTRAVSLLAGTPIIISIFRPLNSSPKFGEERCQYSICSCLLEGQRT